MADDAPKPSLRNTIPSAKLDRIDNDLHWIRRNPVDGPMLSRFAYDHSNTLVYDSKGKCDLLIPNSVPLASDIARLLQHCSPAMIAEFVRGYRLARAAGLIDEGVCNEEVALYLSNLNAADNDRDARIADGKRQMVEIVGILRKEDRKPGGIKSS